MNFCLLFGHVGNEFESGYHVCSRCGLHEYHCNEEYVHAGYLMMPFWHLKRLIFNIINKIKFRYSNWKNKDDDIPF